MAETRIADVIIPEVFTEYTLVPSIYRSRFYRSGLISLPPMLTALLNGGGETFNMPEWEDTAGTSGDNPSETVDQTVNSIGTTSQVARRQFRVKAWGSNALSAILAGSKGVDAAAARVMNYWAQAVDIIAFASLQGVIADNIANDAGDLVEDISAGVGALSNFSDEGVIDAQAKLGENGTLDRGDEEGGGFVAILVHPLVYAWMRKQDLIDYVPVSGQPRPLPFYMNMEVIVDRNAPVDTGVYDSIIVKSNVMSYGVGTANYLPTEMDRDTKKGMGIDELITRRAFALHPYGMKWVETTVADGITPTDAELALAVNWDRALPAENMRLVALRHKIDQT